MITRKITKYIKALRVFEIFLMTGFALIGFIFALDTISQISIRKFLLIFFCTISLVASIYSFNAYAGKEYDKNNLRLRHLSNLSQQSALLYSLIFLCLSILIGLFINSRIFYFIIVIYFLWLLYSYPKKGLKYIPFSGTILHFISQIFHFNMGYIAFRPISLESILISVYFSFLFAGGHMHHEAIDYEADKISKNKTGAIFLGLKKIELFSFGLFTLGIIYWWVLFLQNFISSLYFISFFVAYLFHVALFIYFFNKFKLSNSSRIKYRSLYRFIYLVCCMIAFILNALNI